MKKFFALLCALALSVSLAACRSTGSTQNGAASNGSAPGGSATGSAGSDTGDGLVDDVERGLEDAGNELARAGDDLEDDLDRMIDNGDLTDNANQ